MGFVKFWQCSARCVFFMVRSGRHGLLCFGALIFSYGKAGKVSYVYSRSGMLGRGMAGLVGPVLLG